MSDLLFPPPSQPPNQNASRVLTREDYLTLKHTVLGWSRKKLAEYGISWPPPKGWRKGLLSRYEALHDPATIEMLSMRQLYEEKSKDFPLP